MALDDRKSQVLRAVIEDYINTAEPVGSRTIARKYQLGVSPATIRNEMADLEELGYLEQPHTSAGRIPSDRGYRYYVDTLMETRQVSLQEQETIRLAFERRIHEVDVLIRETVRLLSESTNLATVAAGPQLRSVRFRELHLLPLGGERALLVYVTDSGFVENQVFDLPVEVTMLELQRISGLLTEHLRGRSVESLSRHSLQQLHDELRRYGTLLEQTLDFLTAAQQPGDRQRLYVGGTANILNQPEFRDVDKVRTLFSVLEKEDLMQEVLGTDDRGPGVSVQIGEEIRLREMQDCSVVTATYRVGGNTVGRIGVIGPKRMEYAKVVAVVENVSRYLNDRLDRG
jgi:heat-inducible transcriptional repressor